MIGCTHVHLMEQKISNEEENKRNEVTGVRKYCVMLRKWINFKYSQINTIWDDWSKSNLSRGHIKVGDEWGYKEMKEGRKKERDITEY